MNRVIMHWKNLGKKIPFELVLLYSWYAVTTFAAKFELCSDI